MNNQQSKRQEMEISIKEVFWDLLEQWKAIIIVALIMAMTVSVAQYYKSLRDYEESLELEKERSAASHANIDEHIEDILSALSEDDRNAVQLTLRQEEWLDNQREYFNNSLLLSLDPNAQRRLILSYYLYDAEGNPYEALGEAYSEHLRAKEFGAIVKRHLGIETEEKYIRELIRGEKNQSYSDNASGTIFNVYITLPEGTDTTELEKEITALLNEHSRELSESITPHKIKLIESNDTIGVNETASTRRTNLINNISALNGKVNSRKKSMTEEQAAAYNEIIASKAAEERTDELQETNTEEEEIKKPGISKKLILLGFVLGAMSYAFIYLVWILLRGRVNYASEAESYTSSRQLGEIYYQTQYKGIKKLFHSKYVEHLRYKEKLNAEAQLEKLLSSIGAMCEHEKIKELTLLDLTYSKDFNDRISEGAIGRLKEQGVKVKELNLTNDVDEGLLNSVKNAIFVVSNRAKANKVHKIVGLCDCYDINRNGNIWISEV